MQNAFILALVVSAFILTLVLAYRMFQSWIFHKEKDWAFQLKAENNKALSSLRLTACERVIIMLERITPTSLVMRQNVSGKTAGALQLELIKSIREEFELNVSLQMYVSEPTWNSVRAAKDEVIELVRIAFTKVTPDSPAMELSREIFLLEAQTNNGTIKAALAAIRREIESRY
jgi:hypothetical protein